MSATQRIAIVGAGLGGLATARALVQQGFDVQVFEQSGELGDFGAGINIGPNAAKVFRALGLQDALHAVSFEPAGIVWRDWSDGRLLNRVPLDDAVTRYGASYYVVHRGDLHRLLAESLPFAAVQLNKRCVAVDLTPRSVGLSFADGSQAEADIVIGCDGIRSSVRKQVFGGESARYAGTMCWRTLVPTTDLPRDIHDEHVTHWTGDTREGFVISYYVRQRSFVNIVAVRRQPNWTEESWSTPSTREEMLAAFPDAGSAVGEVLRNATKVYKWGQFTGEHAAQWTKGRVTLLGDAAHAMLATFGQGAAMAFEDSYILARWLAEHRDDPERALAGYEAIRKPRATRLQNYSRTEVRFKKLTTPLDRLRREWVYLTKYGTTTASIYQGIFGYDPVAEWRGARSASAGRT
jgi:salicylate hydroxylase